MKSKIKDLFSQTIIYSLGGMSLRLISFLLLPVYLAYLSPADYGVVEIINILISVLTIIMGFGVSSAVFREYYREESTEYKKKIIGTAFLFLLIVGLVILIILISFSKVLAPILLGVEKQQYLFILLIINTYFAVLLGVNYAVIRAKEKPILFTIFNVLRTIIYATVNIYLIVVLKRGYVGVCEGITSATIITFIASSFILLKNIKLTVDFKILKNILKFGLPLIVSGLSLWILNLTDRYMLKFLLPAEIAFSKIGIYSLAAKFANIVKMIIIQPFSLSWGVAMYKHEKAGDAKAFYARTFKYFLVIEAIFFIGIVIFSQPIIEIIAKNSDYHEAYKIIPLLTASALFSGLFMLLSVGLTLTYKNKLASIATMIAASVNILLNFILIPKFNIYGAAYASMIASVLLIILQYFFAQKNYRISYNILLFFESVIICFGVTYLTMNYNLVLIFRIILLVISIGVLMKISKLRISNMKNILKGNI
ncbi:MAG: oligosaccharide flippase family protein [Candidatus Cloacimonetes bacterium]|nr:oligosaccharide flippase family protein [Candidatus Cloacimonadota bacterium]